MTGSQIVAQIKQQRRNEHCFIKSWNDGHSFVDFDLIDRFIGKVGQNTTIEGFELLDLEQMWQNLIDLDPDKLQRVNREGGEFIEWLWKGSDGEEKTTVYPFSPEGIMTIVDDEFFA